MSICEYKLFRNQKSTENSIFIIKKNDELNSLIKKNKDLSFLLSFKYRGKFEEIFITDLMRKEYSDGNFNKVLELRKEKIMKEERCFVENILEIKYNN